MKKLLFYAVILIFITNYTSLMWQEHKYSGQINDLNTEIINSLGLVAQTQSMVSSTLIESLASKDNVDLGDSAELLEKLKPVIVLGFPDTEEQIPNTFRQVEADLKDIDMMIDAIWMNNLRQKESCELILEHLEK